MLLLIKEILINIDFIYLINKLKNILKSIKKFKKFNIIYFIKVLFLLYKIGLKKTSLYNLLY